MATLPDVAWPLDGGKRLRCAGVLRGLAEVGDVDVAVLFANEPQTGPPVPPDVVVRDWLRSNPAPYNRAVGALRVATKLTPMQVAAQRWDIVEAQICAAWGSREYDLVWYGGLDHATELRHVLRAPRRIVDCDDVETEKWRAFLATEQASGGRRTERLQRRIELPLWARIQRNVSEWADAVVVCSELDRHRFGAEHTAVVPNTYPDPGPTLRTDLPSEPKLLMVANYATDPNVDAAHYTAREILPRVRQRLPAARLRLVGRNVERVQNLSGEPGVDLVGPVEHVGPELAAATLVVVPMRFGGGTRLKVLEAFAHRVPVVSTTLGSEGIGAVDGTHLLLRNDAVSFAAACAMLAENPEHRDILGRGGRGLYEQHFGPGASVAAVGTLVRSVLSRPPYRSYGAHL